MWTARAEFLRIMAWLSAVPRMTQTYSVRLRFAEALADAERQALVMAFGAALEKVLGVQHN